jgi:hypothetical protein
MQVTSGRYAIAFGASGAIGETRSGCVTDKLTPRTMLFSEVVSKLGNSQHHLGANLENCSLALLPK